MTAGSGVVRGLLLGRDGNDTQGPPAWRAHVGAAPQIQGRRTDFSGARVLPACCRESQGAGVAAKWHRAGGKWEEGRQERLPGAGGPHPCQL